MASFLDPANKEIAADAGDRHDSTLGAVTKSRWDRIWPTLACGAGLFSDGYLQGCV